MLENKGASSQDSILKLNDKITKNMKHISELEAKTTVLMSVHTIPGKKDTIFRVVTQQMSSKYPNICPE